MKKIEHLLACLGEEGGEVAQAVGKCLRFGVYDPIRNKDNLINLRKEVQDVLACWTLICNELGVTGEFMLKEVEEKKEKVLRFYEEYNS